MQNQKITGIIEAILKPLRFASKDNFARLHAVKGLERHVTRLCLDASAAGGHTAGFTAVKNLFTGFDGLDVEAKKEAILKALSVMDTGAIHIPLCSDKAEVQITDVPDLTAKEARAMLERLATPLEYCKGIGPKLAARLAGKGLKTVEDVLYFLPIRYEDRSQIKTINKLCAGQAQLTTAAIVALGEVYYGRRRIFEMAVSDGTGILKLKWFHYRPVYMKRYETGQRLKLYGAVTAYGRQFEMIHPDVELLENDDEPAAGGAGIIPVYSQVENFHQKTIRKIVRSVVEAYADFAVSGVPAKTRARQGLVTVKDAFKLAHCITAGHCGMERAKRSLVFDELFLLEVAMALRKAGIKAEKGISLKAREGAGALEKKLCSLLPFRLTNAQEATLAEIKKDMESPHPMNRLVQGDVGSGKTVISFIAALGAVEAGYQAAIMSPTEILSEQHYMGIRSYGDALGIRCVHLTGSLKKKEKDRALAEIENGGADIVVGTHALFQKAVEFRSLGIVIIDEQHRFGVEQRALLRKKGGQDGAAASPDVLIMTATPIPRTLSMTVFGDLDVSIINELPPGRHPVKTRVMREKDRAAAYAIILDELKAGNRAYIVYPLVEESDELSLKDAVGMREHLQKEVFSQYCVGLLHGRMKAAEKEAVMRGFKEGAIHVLAATTVIEVGVDIKDATVILIEHAERFGLSQLHQLRGRVGRSAKRSQCLLLAAWTDSEDTYRRLKVMETTCDGFKIAEEDLKIRGAGDFLGTRQSGLPDFRNAGALGDLALVKAAREEAHGFLAGSPGIFGPENSRIKELLKARWSGRMELAWIG